MGITKKLVSIVLLLCLITGLLSTPAFAAEEPVYLALGDSISSGFGLPEGTPGFVDHIADHYSAFVLENHAFRGNTAAGILAQLESGELDHLIARAGLITLTCGGNDLMAVLYQRIANRYNADHPTAPISPTEITAIFGGTHPTLGSSQLLTYAMQALKGLSVSREFKEELITFTDSLTRVMQYIREINPDACVVIPTQYNPYQSFQNHYFFHIIYEEIEAGVILLNRVISGQADTLRYIAPDVYTAFRGSSSNLCNATPNFPTPELDFHPNSPGHAVYAQVLMDALPIPGAAVRDVSLTNGTVTLSPAGREPVIIAAAFYRQDGRMVGYAQQEAAGSPFELQAELSGSADYVRVFLLDAVTFAPLR